MCTPLQKNMARLGLRLVRSMGIHEFFVVGDLALVILWVSLEK